MSPWYREPQSVWQWVAEHGNEPPSASVLEFAANVEKVRAIIATRALDEFDDAEKLRLAWGIIQAQQGSRN